MALLKMHISTVTHRFTLRLFAYYFTLYGVYIQHFSRLSVLSLYKRRKNRYYTAWPVSMDILYFVWTKGAIPLERAKNLHLSDYISTCSLYIIRL